MNAETAIQSDVGNEQQNKQESALVNANVARGNFISQIAENARKERDDYLEQNGEKPVEQNSGNQEETVQVSQNNDQENVENNNPEGELQSEPQQEEQKPKTVKIKVDGEEREVPEDKILDAGIRALQKESAADKRLEEATRLLKEAKEYVKPKQEEALPQEWDDATIAYAFQHGNDEQKAYAVSLLRGRENTIQPDQIAQHVTQQVLDTVDFKNASTWFQNEYRDIVNDPLLFQLAAISEDKARANGDKRPRQELYKEIGDSLRKWRGTEVKTNQEALKTKQEKKSAAATSIPSASSVKKETKQEAPAKTPQEVIAEMRRKRGQFT